MDRKGLSLTASRKGSFLIPAIVTSLLLGCAPNMIVAPDVRSLSCRDRLLSGHIEYKGNKEYLPRLLAQDPSDHSPLVFRYSYNVSYGRDAVNQALYFFNPLTMVGFPIGADTVVVKANLSIFNGIDPVKTYSSNCVLSKHRTIFSEGETMTQLRGRGLLAVRDNIESQLCADKQLLRKLEPVLSNNARVPGRWNSRRGGLHHEEVSRSGISIYFGGSSRRLNAVGAEIPKGRKDSGQHGPGLLLQTVWVHRSGGLV